MKINTSFEIEDFVVTQKLCVIYPVGRTFAKYTRLDDNLTRQRGNNSFFFIFQHFYFPASGQQAVVTGVVPSRVLAINLCSQ